MKVTVQDSTRTVVIEPGDTPWEGTGIAGRVVKADGARRYTLAVAYPANKPDVGVARDGHKDFTGPEALQDCAWNYLKEHRIVGAWHENGTEGAGEVVESYTWPEGAPDWETPTGYVVKSGDWLAGVIWDETAWGAILAGRMRGISPQGSAQRQRPTRARTATLRK